jgi:hypothetical protein
VFAKFSKREVLDYATAQYNIHSLNLFWELLRGPRKQPHVLEAETFDSLACDRQHRVREIYRVHELKFLRKVSRQFTSTTTNVKQYASHGKHRQNLGGIFLKPFFRRVPVSTIRSFSPKLVDELMTP